MNIDSFKAVAQDALAGASSYINTHHVGQVLCATEAVLGTALIINGIVSRKLIPFIAGLIFTGLNVYGAINPLAGVVVPIIDLGIAMIFRGNALFVLLAAGLSYGVRGDLSGFAFSQIKLF